MSVLWRGSLAQRVRLISGLVLFAFALTHFLNHATGLISLKAMITVDHWRIAVTRSLAGTAVLLAAILAHVGLALVKLVSLRSWRLPRWQIAQALLGLAIPLLLMPHIVGTRIASEVLGINTTYPYVLARIWPAAMLDQTLLLIIVWIHGCIGLHFWLRLTPSYDRWRPFLLSTAAIIPVAALAGVMMQARALTGDFAAPGELDPLRAEMQGPQPDQAASILAWRLQAELGFYAPVGGLILLLAGALWWRRRSGGVTIAYMAGPTVRSPIGATLLEVSRNFGVPHVSVCGGRARCSTCRVRVLEHSLPLPTPGDAEARTLRAIGATPDVRLACQWRPAGKVMVLRLVQPLASAATEAARHADDQGVDSEAAVLFADIRGFTALSERKLAYDIVHILNRFFAAAHTAIQESGGRIDKFMGDGLMALFVDPRGIAFACRAAVAAACRIERELAVVNGDLSAELKEPLRIAMGLHAGRLIIGRIGAGQAASKTVIGPVVNVASRLEAVAKAHDAELALSRVVADWAGLETSGLRVEHESVRGVERPLEIVLVDRVATLNAELAAARPATAA
jgi:adenylate cyclase